MHALSPCASHVVDSSLLAALLLCCMHLALSPLLFIIVSLFLAKTSVALISRRRPSFFVRRLSSNKALLPRLTKMDEFDNDDDFLADFDVDAAVNARRNAPPNDDVAGANKRLKISPTSATAMPQSNAAFSETSPFSRGYTTNPLNELAGPPATTTTSTLAPMTTTSSPPVDERALEKTLQTYFGHSKFRPGQVQVLQSILQGRDAAVFWATGSGKSICYQIPALHTGNVALVVSPLISLMQDQVNKLNGVSQGEPLATFLGSAQTDPAQESAALRGEFRVVYVTPEKLLSSGFLNQLANMHTSTRRLSLIAIDESHCVSKYMDTLSLADCVHVSLSFSVLLTRIISLFL